jgi:hypothetical protein
MAGNAGGNHYTEHMDELPAHLVVIVDRAALLTPSRVAWRSPRLTVHACRSGIPEGVAVR